MFTVNKFMLTPIGVSFEDAENSLDVDDLTMWLNTETFPVMICNGLLKAIVIGRSEVESFPDIWVQIRTVEGKECIEGLVMWAGS